MQARFRSKGPELLVDLAQHVAMTLKQLANTEQQQAEQLGQEIAERMAKHWGGQNIYFPIGLSYQSSLRDQQIYGEFTGGNHAELARRYGVSLQWIYKIIKTERQRELEQRAGQTG
ncbi:MULTISPECIES: Mor transcription activator family protein [Chromobacterium]|uniref:Mor transcription activator family protein n=1 Tax=Chromobacterium TaxID=535 RepID=UPI000D327335|nr:MULTISPECIES: Mor transcription activator family protein [Chromobacterium]MCP1292943.1 DNA-binding protein [Chromobacterium sp. S0633]PTU67625.1 DNA-binding protein [Chromobacterium sp. Panama]UJB32822.1 DNA-binding protein [Chromobacterium sp. Beijing]